MINCLFHFLLIGAGVALLASPPLMLKKNEEEDDEIITIHTKTVRNRSDNEILQEHSKEFWNRQATKTLREKLHQRSIKNPARNVILFLGDGMSIPTIAATRVYLGGEEESLTFEKFPFTGLSKTYCVDQQTADSACSATAYLGGVKANMATIGVTAAVEKKNCTAMNDPSNRVDSIARLFQLKGKKTGLVTTTRVTHASPAGVYAHTAYRRWECDTDVLKTEIKGDPHQCEDIARQLVFGETGRNLRVILGGGRKKLLPKERSGERSDHLDLIEEWKKFREVSGSHYEYVWNREQLLGVGNDTEYLMGLFEAGHMKYNIDRDKTLEPSLSEMTESAIKILRKGRKDSEEGFFLFVEGGRIDQGHHIASAHKALDETAEFSKAVRTAMDMTDEEDTLIVVTADHAHTMSYAGYARRGSDVFGYAGKASDSNYYTILNYANGPGYKPMDEKGARYVPSEEEMNKVGFKWPSTSPLSSETHGADDVAIFARGPWASLFTGVMEQNVIPHLIAFASCTSRELGCDQYKKES